MNHVSFALLRCPSESINKSDSKPQESELFLEGLYLSSKELFRQYTSSEKLEKRDSEKISLSVFKYWIRNCNRCTPFGTFAGVMLVNFNDTPTNIVINKPNEHFREIRLDMGVLSSIVYRLLDDEAVFNKVKLFPNDSIYIVGEEFRFVEYELNNHMRSYKLSSVDRTDYLTSLLSYCKNGVTFYEAVNYLSNYADVDQEEAIEYINHLWTSQLIVSNLEPNLTGKDPLTYLLEQLDQLSITSEITDQLKKIKLSLNNPKPGVDYLKSLEKELFKIVPETQNSLQVDLFLSAKSSTIDRRLMNELVDQLDKLSVLKYYADNYDLKTFKDKFRTRYGETSVPLTIAMDSDVGIGYSHLSDAIFEESGFLDEILFKGNETSGKDYGKFDYLQRYSLIKYDEYLQSNQKEITVTDQELDQLKQHTEKFHSANSLYTMGSLLQQEGKLDSRNFLFDLKLIGGPSAGSLISRFAYANPELLELIKGSLRIEESEYPDCIYAEIIHLPQSRVGNISQRPVLRDYEIIYLGQSEVDDGKKIYIDDLWVSLENDEIVIRSKSLKKRIIPRLTNAHNFVVKSLPLYKFLCDLQTQGNSYFKFWDWGHLATLKHLPRVIYKNILLRKARWIVLENDITNDSQKEISYIKLVQEHFNKKGIPYQITILEGTEELFVDLDTMNGQNLFISLIKKYKRLEISEFLFNDKNCFVKDIDGNPFANELIIPLSRNAPISYDKKPAPKVFQSSEKFFLGSEWLYYKIYAKKSILIEILIDLLPSFIEDNIKQRYFEKFFFLHYNDEGDHIRLRFFNNNVSMHVKLQEELLLRLEPYIVSRKIDSIKMDTYERENDRYIGKLMHHAESIFFNDSVFAVNFMRILSPIKYDISYYSLVIHSVDSFINDFGIDNNQKMFLVEILQKSFFKEFNGDKFLQKQLNDKYRLHRKDISQIFEEFSKGEMKTSYFNILKQRSALNRIEIAKMLSNVNENKSEVLFKIIPSYIHMSINRLFSSNQRKHELIIYHLLERYLYQLIQIRKSSGSNS